MSKRSLKRNISKSQEKYKSKSAKICTSNTPNEELALSHFLILPLILSCLNPKDKIQLSSVNKSFRLRLEPSIFHNIKLFPYNYLNNPNQYGGNKNKRGVQSILLEQIIKLLGPKSYLVKEITIRDDFNSIFAKKFFSTFFHLIKVNIIRCTLKAPILIDSLKPLEQLEHLYAFICYFPNDDKMSDSKFYYRLPKTIKTFKFETCYDNAFLDQVEIIDNTYTNLQRVTLYNTDMFYQFQWQYQNLIELDILYCEVSDFPLIEKILVNNSQITKLSIPGEELTESFMNFILSIKNLTIFKLNDFSLTATEGWKLIDNSTITTIEFYQFKYFNIHAFLLRCCKNLHTIQSRGEDFDAEYFNWQGYHGSLKVIEYTDCSGIRDNLDQFVNCLSLKKIVLMENDCSFTEYQLSKLDYLECWKVEKGETIILTKLD